MDCAICHQDLENGSSTNVITKRGLDTLIECSLEREDYELHNQFTAVANSTNCSLN